MSQQTEEQQRKEIDDKIAALKASNFKQQMLPAWRPVPSFGSTMITFGLFGIVFLGLGIMLYVLSDKIQEVTVQYDHPSVCGLPTSKDNVGSPNIGSNATVDKLDNLQEGMQGTLCKFPLNIDAEMKGPVFVYYQLDNFYQNHRRYVKSRDYQQLMGENRTTDEVSSTCDPIVKNSDLASVGITLSVDLTPLAPDATAIPCGLIAKSFFNDTYAISSVDDDVAPVEVASGQCEHSKSEDPKSNKATFCVTNSETGQRDKKLGVINLQINDTNIAWESDKEYKFKNQKGMNCSEGQPCWKSIQWKNITDEHFIVWMRTAGLPNFRKLYGMVSGPDGVAMDLDKGSYYIEVENLYNVNSFNGKKWFVLSTTNMLGGRNYFLAICYIVVGALCIVFAIIFFVAYMRKQSLQTSQQERAAN